MELSHVRRGQPGRVCAAAGVSRSHLCDVEKGRKVVSPERAAAWAKVLGFPETVFVKLALQEQLDRAGVRMTVQVEAA